MLVISESMRPRGTPTGMIPTKYTSTYPDHCVRTRAHKFKCPIVHYYKYNYKYIGPHSEGSKAGIAYCFDISRRMASDKNLNLMYSASSA